MVTAPQLPEVGTLVLGLARAEPGLLKLSGPNGRRTLEPRVMLVLVELLRAGGETVSRDMLAERCWNGRAVSEDALNRAVAKLRRDVRAVAGDALALETIRRVGYRLHLTESVPPATTYSDTVAPAIDLETRALGAMFEGTAEGTSTAIRYLQEAVRQRPSDGPTWGSLAMAYVLSLPFAEADRLLVAARARESAVRAQTLRQDEGRSLAALASLEPTFGAWTDKDARLQNALSIAPPGTAPLIFQRVLFLASVGLMAEVLRLIEPLAKAAPLVPWIQSARVHALAATGNADMALEVSAAALARWPRARLVWLTHFHLLLVNGRSSIALEATRDLPEDGLTRQERTLAIGLAEASAAPDATRRRQVLDAYQAQFSVSQTLAEQAILAAAQLGDVDRAYALLGRLYREDLPLGHGSVAFPKIGLVHPHERSTALLFLQPMRAVREDRRFNQVLEAIGLPRHRP